MQTRSILTVITSAAAALTAHATDYNFGSATQNFTITASDNARVLAPNATFADTGVGGIYWRGTAADSVYMHFDLSSLQGVTLDTPVSLKQTINATYGGQTNGSAINTANAAWTAVTGGAAPAYTAIAGATNATGNFGTGAIATWSVPAATFATYIGNPAFHGLVLSGANGTTAHFSTAATLTGTYTGGEIRVLNGTDWSAASYDGGTKTLALSGASDVTGGNMILGTGTTMSLSGSATLGGGTFAGTFANSGTLSFGSSANQSLNGQVSGIGGLTKTGTGTLTLNAASTFTGATSVTEGTLKSTNLNGYRSHVSIATGATFETNVATNVNAANSFNITGTGTLKKTGAGYWLLGSGGRVGIAMSPGGLLDIQEGTVGTGNHQQSFTGNQGSINIATGATLDMSAENVWADALTGGGSIIMSYGASGARTVTVGVANGGGNFSGTIGSAGLIAVAKTGIGTQTLSGTNTYAGNTTVSAGRLNINGSITSSTTVGAAGTAATLGGDGTITGAVTLGANGTLRPGQGGTTDRTLRITGNVTTTMGSQMVFNVDGETASDQLICNGTVNLANAALAVTLTDTSFTLLGAGQGLDFLNSGASIYQLISGTTTGMFSNVTETMDANLLSHFGLSGTQYTTTINGQQFWVAQGSSYLVAIPETSSALLALLGSAALLRRRRD